MIKLLYLRWLDQHRLFLGIEAPLDSTTVHATTAYDEINDAYRVNFIKKSVQGIS